MNKILFILILSFSSCKSINIFNKPHVGIIISKAYNDIVIEAQITPYYFILPNLTTNEWDSLQIGDTILINPITLKLVY